MTIFLPQHTSRGSTAGWFCDALINYSRISTLLKSPGVLKNDCATLLESTGLYFSISKLVETAISSLEEIISQMDQEMWVKPCGYSRKERLAKCVPH